MTVIHIGEGRHIEIEEGLLKAPPVTSGPITPEQAHKEWLSRQHSQTQQFTNGRKAGVPRAMTDKEALPLLRKAKRQAKQDMANLKKAGIDLGAAGNEALEASIEIMRKPGDTNTRLKAARQILEWTLPKPAASTNVTINQAEAWLDSLAEADGSSD